MDAGVTTRVFIFLPILPQLSLSTLMQDQDYKCQKAGMTPKQEMVTLLLNLYIPIPKGLTDLPSPCLAKLELTVNTVLLLSGKNSPVVPYPCNLTLHEW